MFTFRLGDYLEIVAGKDPAFLSVIICQAAADPTKSHALQVADAPAARTGIAVVQQSVRRSHRRSNSLGVRVCPDSSAQSLVAIVIGGVHILFPAVLRGLDAPVQVAVLIVDLPLLVIDPQAQVAGVAVAHADRCLGKGDLVRIRNGDGGAAHLGAALVQIDPDVAGLAVGRENARGAVNGAVIRVHRPGKAAGQGRRRAGAVRARRGEAHHGAGGIDLVGGSDGSVVKDAVRLRPGDKEDGGTDLPLLAVRGMVAGLGLAVAIPAGDEGGGTAAVQQHCRLAAPGLHHLGRFELVVAAGDGVALAVADHGDHGAVRLDADGAVGHVPAAVAHVDFPVLHQQAAAAHGIAQLRQGSLALVVGDDSLAALLVDAEVVAAAAGIIDLAVNDQQARGLAGGHVVVVRVQSRRDGAVGILLRAGEVGLGVLHLAGHGLHPPVDGLLLQDVLHAGITGHDFRLAQVHFAEVVDVLVQTVRLVGIGHILRDAGGQGIRRFRDEETVLLPIVEENIARLLPRHFGGGARLQRQQLHRHQQREQQADRLSGSMVFHGISS